MKYLPIFLFLVCLNSYSQEKNLEIYLKNDSIITTDWIKLHKLPFFQKPFVRIDNKKGHKIKLEDIKSYRGVDQFGHYRELHSASISSNGSNRFTERWFYTDSTEKCKIFYNRFLFSGKKPPSGSCHTSYQLNRGAIKNLNYRNIKQDFSILGNDSGHLKGAKQIRFLQYISVAVATGLLATIVYDKWPSPGNRSLENKHNTLFLTSSCLVAFSLYMEIPKKQKLLKAIKACK